MNLEELRLVKKEKILEISKRLKRTDIDFLVDSLAQRNDTIRYNAFLLLREISQQSPVVYEYWDEFDKKLGSSNSYQRNIGLRLISENVRWDKKAKFQRTLERYLPHCTDVKFVTSRQAIQGLVTITQSTARYDKKIQRTLERLSLAKYNAGQQKLLRKDMSDVRGAISCKTNRK